MALRPNEIVLQNPKSIKSVAGATAAQPVSRQALSALRQVTLRAWTAGSLRGPEAQFLAMVRAAVPGTKSAASAKSKGMTLDALPPEVLASIKDGRAASHETDRLAAASPQLIPAQTLAAYQAGEVTFGKVLDILAASGPQGFKLAEELLKERGDAIEQFLQSWSESLRKNAERDKKAAKEAHEKAERQRAVDEQTLIKVKHAISQQQRNIEKKRSRLQSIFENSQRVTPGDTTSEIVLSPPRDLTPTAPQPRVSDRSEDAWLNLRKAAHIEPQAAHVATQAALDLPDEKVGVRIGGH